MILSKSSHDLDILVWLAGEKKAEKYHPLVVYFTLMRKTNQRVLLSDV